MSSEPPDTIVAQPVKPNAAAATAQSTILIKISSADE
jgi:hypothetical protein